MVLVDGSRSVADIAGLADIEEYEATRILYGLVTAGLIEVAAPVGSSQATAAPEATTKTAPSAFPSSGTEAAVPEEWFEDPADVAPTSQSSTDRPGEAPPEPALPAVDRAAAVRELSGLIQEPRSRPEPPSASPSESSPAPESGPENGRGRFARFVRRSGD